MALEKEEEEDSEFLRFVNQAKEYSRVREHEITSSEDGISIPTQHLFTWDMKKNRPGTEEEQKCELQHSIQHNFFFQVRHPITALLQISDLCRVLGLSPTTDPLRDIWNWWRQQQKKNSKSEELPSNLITWIEESFLSLNDQNDPFDWTLQKRVVYFSHSI